MRRYFQRLRAAARVLLYGDSPLGAVREVPALSPEEALEARAIFPATKFFIFGHARSGTTLLARLCRLHPEVHCSWQAHFFTRAPLLQSLVSDPEVADWLSQRSNRWNRGSDLSPVVLRAAADFILERESRRLGKRIVGDKSPNSLMDGEAVRLLHKVYPDGLLLFIVRDGRDTLLSHRIQQFIDAPQHLNQVDKQIRLAFSEDPEPFLKGETSLFTPQALSQGAEGWVSNLRETSAHAKALFGEQYLDLRYEDLLSRPATEMARVWGFLGAEPAFAGWQAQVQAEMARNPDADWQQEKRGDLAKNISKGQAGSWRELFTAADKALFKSIAGQTLIDWGYEQDLNW